jgi:parvulin-like peptidyl-prolyl isomerase
LAKKKTTEKPQRQLTRRQLSHYKKQKRRQRFIFIGGIAVIAVVVLLILGGWLAGEYIPRHATVIKVGDYEYNTQYYIDAVKYYVNLTGSDAMTISSSAITQIENNTLVMIDAAEKGISVEDEEARELLDAYEIEVNKASIDIIKAQLLSQKVREEYFTEQVPVSDNQVNIRVMLLENERQAAEIRGRLQGSENFTSLAEEFSLHASTNATGGEVGWHPKEIIEEALGTSVPGDFAFSAETGALSEPLYDENISKKTGYWLINVQEKTEEGAKLKVILLGSEEEAEDVRAQIDTSENVTALIEEYSQHATSRTKGGEMGPVTEGAMSEGFDAYVFDENVETGVWSQPIRDNTVSTTGGYWLVEVIDKDDDREISEEDRETLADNAYYDWANNLMTRYEGSIDITNLTLERIQWAIEKVEEELE